MPRSDLDADPRGLIREAYRMELGPEECRSVFFDWAVGLPGGAGQAELAALMARYGAARPDHPMTALLREGLDAPAPAGRKRGRRRHRAPKSDSVGETGA